MGRFESPPGDRRERSQAERQAEKQARHQQKGSPTILRILIGLAIAILGVMAYVVLKDKAPNAPAENYIRDNTYVAGVVSGSAAILEDAMRHIQQIVNGEKGR